MRRKCGKDEHMCQSEKNENRATIIDTVKILVVVEVWLQCVHQLAWHLVNFVDDKHGLQAFGVPGGDNLVKGVQCYELFGGIALKIHTFSSSFFIWISGFH